MNEHELAHDHSPEAIAHRLSGSNSSYLRDYVYGGIDGSVTTFAIVAGVGAAGLSHGAVLVLGLASLFADAFSMAASNWLGVRADVHRAESIMEIERDHIRRIPEGEREEVRQLYEKRGFTGELLERVVEVITENEERWLQTMMREEHGFPEEEPSPWRSAMATFWGFLLAGAVPLVPFGVAWIWGTTTHTGTLFLWSTVATAGVFAVIGGVKGRFLNQGFGVGAFETLAIGGLASGLAYGVGLALRSII